jgi:hypothetical protein
MSNFVICNKPCYLHAKYSLGAAAKAGGHDVGMFCGNGPELGEKLGRVFGYVGGYGHRKDSYGNWFGRVRQKVIACVKDAAAVAFWDIDKLEQSRDIATHGNMGVFALELTGELSPVGRYEFRMALNAVAHRPGRTLGQPVDRAKHELH